MWDVTIIDNKNVLAAKIIPWNYTTRNFLIYSYTLQVNFFDHTNIIIEIIFIVFGNYTVHVANIMIGPHAGMPVLCTIYTDVFSLWIS